MNRRHRGEYADGELDEGIASIVKVLQEHGVETFESCEGGEGHTFPEPTVRFHGEPSAGFHALSVAMAIGLPVAALRRAWSYTNGELTGPHWELTFYSPNTYPD